MSGCFGFTDFDDVQTTRQETYELSFVDQGNEPRFDVVFVVDRPIDVTQAILDAMENMSTGVPGIMDQMDTAMAAEGVNYTTDDVDIRIGVVTSDLGAGDRGFEGCGLDGDEGRVLAIDPVELELNGYPGCGTEAVPYIHVRGHEVVNMPGVTDVNTAVECLMMSQMFRPTSCRIRQPLKALSRAITQRESDNSHFFRDDAGLSVVFISAEDDCSAEDLSVYDETVFGAYHCVEQGLDCEDDGDPNTLTRCKDRPAEAGGALFQTDYLVAQIENWKAMDRVVVSLMAGPFNQNVPARVVENLSGQPDLAPNCATPDEAIQALPGIRLTNFKNRFKANSVFHEICDPGVDSLFGNMSAKLAAQLAYRCMPKRPVDSDGNPDNGIQAQCQVWDVLLPGDENEIRTELPRCEDVPFNQTCWEMMPEPGCQSDVKLVVHRPVEAEPGTVVRTDCSVELD